jgi:hypothetical protein
VGVTFFCYLWSVLLMSIILVLFCILFKLNGVIDAIDDLYDLIDEVNEVDNDPLLK